VLFRSQVTFANGDEVEARVVGTDPSTDVAVLELTGDRDVEPLELGSSESLEVGDPVAAIGSPFGLGGTLTSGIVSALDREIEAPNGFTIEGAVQTDAALNSGNSGGPLLDSHGRVVGIAAQIRSENGGNVGVGYAVPIETARSVAERLLAGDEIEYAYLGVSLGEANDEGVPVDVVDGGPADEAGVEDGDVITSVDGAEVTEADDVRDAVNAKEPGDTLTLEVERAGDTEQIEVELGERPEQAE
jgi:putative serine protease PepD